MVVRWSPVDNINRLEGFMRNLFEGSPQTSEESGRLTRPSWIPPVDAWETEEGLHMLFDLPGVTKEAIAIEVEGDQLTIRGDRKGKEDVKFLRRERVFGPFFRSFTLETPIDREKIKATYKAGVLEIFLPKREEAKPKQIQVEIEEE